MRIFLLPEVGMNETEILPAREVAQLLGTSPSTTRNAIARRREGNTIPPSFKLGGRRVWLRSITCARSI
jgi:predicted DNA-binding transcriptional regulator AlpA